jgi:serine/threonine-protein kinase PknK
MQVLLFGIMSTTLVQLLREEGYDIKGTRYNGPLSVVYEVTDGKKELVAKTVNRRKYDPEISNSEQQELVEEQLRALKHEAEILGALRNYKRIPRLEKFIDDETDPTLIMRKIPGRELIQIIGDVKEGIINPEVILEGALKRLRYISTPERNRKFNKPLVHGDIKPDNIFWTGGSGTGSVRLIDFSGSRTIDEDPIPIFTAPYLPHEFLFDRHPSIQTDLYGLGATMIALCFGKLPVEIQGKKSYGNDLTRLTTKGPFKIIEKDFRWGMKMARVINGLVEFHPSDRYETPQQALDVLKDPAA